jgi:diacylglycerol kinase (ATP)
LWQSFGHAFRGLGLLLRTEANARLHLAATLAVIAAGFGCKISRAEWIAVIAAIGLVWTAEGVNTAIEAVVDLASSEPHPLARRAKDVAAGAVLLAAVAAAVIGGLVFGPRLLALVP